jgi:hypothetical protein
MKTILFHARESGIAIIMKSLIPIFELNDWQLVFDIDGSASEIIKVRDCIPSENIDLIVCGYDDCLRDCTGRLLKNFEGKCPTLGLLDSWKGVDRFWYPDGVTRPLTERLVVPDVEIKNYLIKRGIPADILIVASHPVIEHFQNLTNKRKEELRYKTKRQLGLSSEKPLLMILSEPLKSKSSPTYSLLKTQVKSGELLPFWIDKQYSEKYQIVVRFHPREEYVVPYKWIDLTALDFESSISIADRVVGLASTTMAFAVAFGLDVYCLDREIKNWYPEKSDIPESLWEKLISDGIFQNDPDRIIKYDRQPIQRGSLKIVNEAKKLILNNKSVS